MSARGVRVIAAAAFAAGLFAFSVAGCAKKPGDDAGAKTPVNAAAATESKKGGELADPAAALEEAIALWARGDRDGAEAKFMAIDWKAPDQGRPLFGLTEKAYIVLPAKEPQLKSAELLAHSENLRALVRFLLATANTARDSGDPQKARTYFAAICDCGKWLSDESHALALVNAIGKAFETLGRTGLESMKP